MNHDSQLPPGPTPVDVGPPSAGRRAPAPVPLRLADGSPAADAFTLDATLLHLNHGSYGAVPRVSQAHQQRSRALMEAAPLVWFPRLPHLVAEARHRVARFLHADPGSLAFVPNASGGASVVFSSLPVTRGAEIVVTDHGYGAVTMGAERLARRWGGTVRTVPVPLGADHDEATSRIADGIGRDTALLVVDQVTSPTARELPVAAVSRIARERGVPMLVDGAHAPGLLADPLRDLEADFWVGNMHKFPCAPRGTGVLVARGPLVAELNPLIDSWGATHPYPERFDDQGTQDLTGWLAAPASIDLVEEAWGWDAARAYMSALADFAVDTIAGAFTALTGEDHHVDVGMPVAALRLVRLPAPLATGPGGGNALRDRVIDELGALCSFTSFDGVGYLRISTHVYNTAADYEDFAERCVPRLWEWARAS
jgi:isopenicillin-N epimerase